MMVLALPAKEYETVCGDKCCKGGQECQGDSRSGYACTLPLLDKMNVTKDIDGKCTRCLIHNCCSDGLKCTADGHDGAALPAREYETVCGDKCCKGGQECQGDSRSGYACTLP